VYAHALRMGKELNRLGNSVSGQHTALRLVARTVKGLWAVEAGVAGALDTLGRRLRPERASARGRSLLRRLGPRLRKTAVIRRNLEIAFPEKDVLEIAALVRDVWGNMGSVLAEYGHLETICHREAEQRLEILRQADFDVFKPDGPPAIFVAAHLANWEIAPGAVVKLGVPLTGIYTPLTNPRLDRLLYRARERLGCGMVEREGAVRHLVAALRNGVSVGLIVDQRVDAGAPVPFFGHAMNSSITPAQLAQRFDCELIPVQVQRLESARFRVIFHAPVRPDHAVVDDRERVLQMTARLNALFEAWIRERPGEWWCAKRRWAKQLYGGRQERTAAGIDCG